MARPNPKVPKEERCPKCRGWGFTIRRERDHNEPHDCLACDGTGRKS